MGSTNIKICHLASGSAGNSLLIESGEESILIDAGISARQIKLRMEKIGSDLSSLKGIVITHEHSDHIRGLDVFSREVKVPVYLNERTHNVLLKKLKNPICKPHIMDTGSEVFIGGFRVRTFAIPHDAEEPVGVIVWKNSTKIGIATDLGHSTHLVRERLGGANILILESNHNVSCLMKGPYPWTLKQRIRGKEGHLSNEDALALLCYLRHDDLRHVIFSHVSDKNNTLEHVNKAFKRWVPEHHKNFSFSIVAPNEMGTPYNMSI